ncbi:HPF/RaiA family ribosome-associated protein [Fodinicola acaciae]|uniref:HPF/RaiA family ribosome-associated protein n=1 Tax=Fodinicola acaciae TaxID=2681555 RepID=UPI0013D56E41|nr:HPF/RaiA family ribosome-associated protein [Fodinicola acaciae]
MTRLMDNSTPAIQVAVGSGIATDIASYARRKLRVAIKHVHGSVISARVRLTRSMNPSVTEPLRAQVNLDIAGAPIRAQATAGTAVAAVDLVMAKIARQAATVGGRRLDHRCARVEERSS